MAKLPPSAGYKRNIPGAIYQQVVAAGAPFKSYTYCVTVWFSDYEKNLVVTERLCTVQEFYQTMGKDLNAALFERRSPDGIHSGRLQEKTWYITARSRELAARKALEHCRVEGVENIYAMSLGSSAIPASGYRRIHWWESRWKRDKKIAAEIARQKP
jgi:hypothetical protein